jgi:hypothetical protein
MPGVKITIVDKTSGKSEIRGGSLTDNKKVQEGTDASSCLFGLSPIRKHSTLRQSSLSRP